MMKTLSRTVAALAAVVTLALASPGAMAGAAKTSNIGWTAWADAEAVTKPAKRLIEEGLDTKVGQTNCEPAVDGCIRANKTRIDCWVTAKL